MSLPTDDYTATSVTVDVSTAYIGAPLNGSIGVTITPGGLGISYTSTQQATLDLLEAVAAAAKDYLETTYPSATVAASITYQGQRNSAL